MEFSSILVLMKYCRINIKGDDHMIQCTLFPTPHTWLQIVVRNLLRATNFACCARAIICIVTLSCYILLARDLIIGGEENWVVIGLNYHNVNVARYSGSMYVGSSIEIPKSLTSCVYFFTSLDKSMMVRWKRKLLCGTIMRGLSSSNILTSNRCTKTILGKRNRHTKNKAFLLKIDSIKSYRLTQQ